MSKLVVGLLLRGIRRNVVDLCLCMSLDASQPPSRRPLVESRSKQSCLSSSGKLKKKKVGCFIRLERNAQMWLSKTRRSWIADFCFVFFFLSDADVDRFASNKLGVRTETQLGECRDLPRSIDELLCRRRRCNLKYQNRQQQQQRKNTSQVAN